MMKRMRMMKMMMTRKEKMIVLIVNTPKNYEMSDGKELSNDDKESTSSK